ncbi:uncharacterized protein I206_101777 [Kwoniella pini CBS 10737]|uniref:Uncharacterized protein n=1 Tax=Kwoniella pini CBS 10737 TaxID=1296096 RepID=A0A1B9HVQ5_9TREE|nr:uncharacterized protein I206_06251 [Kwoniella pini CBS 10737]OCF47355.1 hypothetical protein I206_06251 [Kwoniella pini CBS 10737]
MQPHQQYEDSRSDDNEVERLTRPAPPEPILPQRGSSSPPGLTLGAVPPLPNALEWNEVFAELGEHNTSNSEVVGGSGENVMADKFTPPPPGGDDRMEGEGSQNPPSPIQTPGALSPTHISPLEEGSAPNPPEATLATTPVRSGLHGKTEQDSPLQSLAGNNISPLRDLNEEEELNNGGGKKKEQPLPRNFRRTEAFIREHHKGEDIEDRDPPCERCKDQSYKCLGPPRSQQPNSRCWTCSSMNCSHYRKEKTKRSIIKKAISNHGETGPSSTLANRQFAEIARYIALVDGTSGSGRQFFFQEISRLAKSIGMTFSSVTGGKYDAEYDESNVGGSGNGGASGS